MINKQLILFVFAFGFFHLLHAQNDALSFNGTADYVEIPNSDLLNIGNNLTAEAWVQLDKISGNNMILGKSYCGASEYAYNLYVADGKIRWGWNNDGNCNFTSVEETVNVVFNPGECHHIAVTHSSSEVKIYLDGIEVPTALIQGNYSNIAPSTEPFRVGIYKGLNGNFMFFMDGKIDELKIWDNILTPQQIAYSMNNVIFGNQANLLLYYDFENLTAGSFITIPNKATSTGSILDGVSSVTSPAIESSCAELNNLNVSENNLFQEDIVYLFPNPTSGSLNIKLKTELSENKIFLFDSFGNIVKEDLVSGLNVHMQLSDLPNGVYFLSVDNQMFRVIKN